LESGAGRFLRSSGSCAKPFQIYEGMAQIQRHVIAREIFMSKG